MIKPGGLQEVSLKKPETLIEKYDEPEDIKYFDGFTKMKERELNELYGFSWVLP